VIFTELSIPGAFSIDPERHVDERGSFARLFCADEFAQHGLSPAVAQASISVNRARGTLRGLHYQMAPHGECKLIRCSRGSIFDVLVDVRPESRAYCSWVGLELTSESGRMLYAPEGVAHGFLTLEDGCEIHYQISVPYASQSALGVRWDDPRVGIAWPEKVSVISPRDAGFPDIEP
jgi:dTDP-4-dehydrorhamnose 3,5-epimerase